MRRILLPIFLLIGFAAAAALWPAETSAAPSNPREAVGNLDREDLVAPEGGHEDANYHRPRQTFDGDQPANGANRPRPERMFDEDQPENGANRPRPERMFDEDQPENGPNHPRPERPFDEDPPAAGPSTPRPERPFDEDQPQLSSNPSTGPVQIRYGSQDLRVDVFDVTGRRIATLAGASGTTSWDGRDTNGRRVGRGIYFARVLTAGDGSAKVVRIARL